jgi:deoxyribonuclease V
MTAHQRYTAPSDAAEAVAIQDRLRRYVDTSEEGPTPGGPGAVVGVDVAYDDPRQLVVAAAVALDGRTGEVLEEVTTLGRMTFPYVSGLLAFRELPAVLDALERLTTVPTLVVCDGYGRAHPRGFGLASHLGVLSGLPTIGVAKSPPHFRYDPPGARRGSTSPLLDGAEEVGRVLRTQDGVKPVFVSSGHRVSLDRACAHTLRLAREYRLPETTRRADALCRRVLRELHATDAPGSVPLFPTDPRADPSAPR